MRVPAITNAIPPGARAITLQVGAGAALAAALVLSYSYVAAGPYPATALVLLAAAGAVFPSHAILLVVGLSPLATIAARTFWSLEGDWAEALVLALACGWCFRRLLGLSRLDLGPFALPWAALVAVVLASIPVQLAVARAVSSPERFGPMMADVVRHYSIASGGVAAPIEAAARLLEGLFLFALLYTYREQPGLLRRVLRIFVVGAAAVAVLNLARIAGSALRADAPLRQFAELLRSVRLSLPYGDVNAAGSYFVLALLTAVGMMAGSTWRSRAAWLAPAGLCACGLWISGSRAAIIALVVGAGAFAMMRIGLRARAGVLCGLAVAAAGILWVFPNPIFSASATGALSIRYELARVALRMWQADPLFGVGIGQFYERSGALITDAYVRTLYPSENAHNNFLQIGAELGLAGLVPLLVILYLALRGMWRGWDGTPASALVQGAAAGTIAFLVTCLGGHPLLISEVSIGFWVVLAVVGASGYHGNTAPWRVSPGMAVASLVVLLALSLPLRVAESLSGTNLEHVGYGVSSWEREEDGTLFRRLQEEATLFVPSNAAYVDMPYRLERAGATVALELYFRNRIADRILVASDEWRVYRLMVPPDADAPMYLPLRLKMTGGKPSSVLIGKLLPHARPNAPR